MTAEQVWAARPEGPFVELIDFADNEGMIGPRAAAKLAKDFADTRRSRWPMSPTMTARKAGSPSIIASGRGPSNLRPTAAPSTFTEAQVFSEAQVGNTSLKRKRRSARSFIP
jgi:hypothetical protein